MVRGPEMLESAAGRFRKIVPDVDFWSIRLLRGRGEQLTVRKDILQPVVRPSDAGAMITIREGGGIGYAATRDFSGAGLERAAGKALAWARRSSGHMADDIATFRIPPREGEYESPCAIPWESIPLTEKIGFLTEMNELLSRGERIIEWSASFSYVEEETLLITSGGGRVRQLFRYMIPNMSAVAAERGESQRRTYGGRGHALQGGWEAAAPERMREAAPLISEEAQELLAAPNCPEGRMDLVLAPDQMILQIHESIGHPIELDRILGDERNYAGTSFVTLDDFGKFRYGSELLNVIFDPGREGQLASYAFDDDGTPAERAYLIREGVLLRGLGGALSQARSGAPGVACSRAVGWNRPPIDRMANLNVEPGDSSLDEIIASVESGVYMKTNCSWSIDDSRLKFQFGCEWARRIEKGKLAGVVKNPNYRGITPEFWRSLRRVGGPETFEVLGTPNCGKGEPNQMIRVGHASPVCLFGGVEVFGGE